MLSGWVSTGGVLQANKAVDATKTAIIRKLNRIVHFIYPLSAFYQVFCRYGLGGIYSKYFHTKVTKDTKAQSKKEECEK
jgi:hypothetical protein